MELEKTIEKPMKTELYMLTDQGTRDYQQDKAYAECKESEAMAVICDGMGGMNGGEAASSAGVLHFSKSLKEKWPIQNIPEFLVHTARSMDRVVYELTDENGRLLKAGSTVVSAIVKDSRLYWMSVGDSRLYLIRDGSMECLTAAHNYKTMLQEKLTDGQIDVNEYNREIKQGEALTSFLGMGNISLIDVNQTGFGLEYGDILLLCSDGLYKTLTDEQILALVQESGGHIRLAGERLLETAQRLGRRGRDNTTLILLKMTAGAESQEVCRCRNV